MFYNQMTLRSLPEAERSRHAHAFKICKSFQVRGRGSTRPLTGGAKANAVCCRSRPPPPQHLLCVSLLDDQSLVAVERPLLDIQAQLPPPVRQKKFAT